MDTADLVLLPWCDAQHALERQPHELRVLTPPYPATSSGVLRVLRVREREGAPLEVVCGYERYERP